MRITLQTRGPSSEHETVRVFVNGASAGLLTMTIAELKDFRARIEGKSVLLAQAPNDTWEATYGEKGEHKSRGETVAAALVNLAWYLDSIEIDARRGPR